MENKMDGSTAEHSDSDSGESWTLLEKNSSCSDDCLDFPDKTKIVPKEEGTKFATEKDEDTDGISIISDSEPESNTPCEQLNFDVIQPQKDSPTDDRNDNYITVPPNIFTEELHNDTYDELLRDSTGKLKTYVHRRNKKLSAVLNIIVLGSVITAAGVAIGHMWGVRDDCAQYTPTSVNKILSNLYKLQEENTYLRNKIKELTLANSLQIYHRKIHSDIEKPIAFKQKCKKVFEESLSNKNVKSTKCVDYENNSPKSTETPLLPEYEQEFLSDINKLKNFYKQNKSWLDVEVAKRLKNEELSLKTMKQALKANKSYNDNQKVKQNLQTKLDVVEPVKKSNDLNNTDKIVFASEKKRVTYADSLKSEKDDSDKIVNKRNADVVRDRKDTAKKQKKSGSTNDYLSEKELKKSFVDKENVLADDYVSDNELQKDNRYTHYKHKQERKKYDRHKSNRKNKLRNKYEQWEMKGGYVKDYDDLSIISSSQESIENMDKKLNEEINQDFNINDIIDKQHNKLKENQIPKTDTEKAFKRKKDKKKFDDEKVNDDNWYEKRVVFRKEARKKLEHDMFGENSANNAGWYFRRMQKREQCRVKPDNSTYTKFSKRNLNFKTKY